MNYRIQWVLFSAIFMLPTALLAAPITIVNPGFEALYLGGNLPGIYNGDVPPGAFPVGQPPAGWSAWDPGNAQAAPPATRAYIGVLNPGTQAANGTTYFPNGAPEGDNVALLYVEGAVGGSAYGIEQTLNAVLEPNTQYILQVQVGNIASGTALVQPYLGFGFYNLDGFPGYRVELLAGGSFVAQVQNGVDPAEGAFLNSVLSFATGNADPQLGQTLSIRLINLNQADVAGVRGLEVDFDDVRLDASPVAIPGPSPLALLAFGPLLALRARWRGR